MTDKSGLDLQALADAAADRWGIPRKTLHWQIGQESSWNPRAVGAETSHGRALGIGQFMPATAAQFHIDPLDPQQAIDAMAHYDAMLHAKGGTWEDTLERYGTFSPAAGSGDPIRARFRAATGTPDAGGLPAGAYPDAQAEDDMPDLSDLGGMGVLPSIQDVPPSALREAHAALNPDLLEPLTELPALGAMPDPPPMQGAARGGHIQHFFDGGTADGSYPVTAYSPLPFDPNQAPPPAPPDDGQQSLTNPTPGVIPASNGITDPSGHLTEHGKDLALTVGGMTAGMTDPLIAYHGSPHDFDRFNISKIGSGEGNQSYGHGLYFADTEGTARSYRDQLTRDSAAVNPKAIAQTLDPNNEVHDSLLNLLDYSVDIPAAQKAIARAQKQWMAGVDPTQPLHPDTQWALDHWQQVKDLLASKLPEGRMYQVAIHADPASLLDWDSGLGNQSPQVQRALRDLGYGTLGAGEWRPIDGGHAYFVGDSPHARVQLPADSGSPISWSTKKYSGSDYGVNDAMSSALSALNFSRAGKTGAQMWEGLAGSLGKPQAAQALYDQGVPGVRYLDGLSRASGEGTSNYVVFHHDPVQILRKYERGGLACLAEGGDSSSGGSSGTGGDNGGASEGGQGSTGGASDSSGGGGGVGNGGGNGSSGTGGDAGQASEGGQAATAGAVGGGGGFGATGGAGTDTSVATQSMAAAAPQNMLGIPGVPDPAPANPGVTPGLGYATAGFTQGPGGPTATGGAPLGAVSGYGLDLGPGVSGPPAPMDQPGVIQGAPPSQAPSGLAGLLGLDNLSAIGSKIGGLAGPVGAVAGLVPGVLSGGKPSASTMTGLMGSMVTGAIGGPLGALGGLGLGIANALGLGDFLGAHGTNEGGISGSSQGNAPGTDATTAGTPFSAVDPAAAVVPPVVAPPVAAPAPDPQALAPAAAQSPYSRPATRSYLGMTGNPLLYGLSPAQPFYSNNSYINMAEGGDVAQAGLSPLAALAPAQGPAMGAAPPAVAPPAIGPGGLPPPLRGRGGMPHPMAHHPHMASPNSGLAALALRMKAMPQLAGGGAVGSEGNSPSDNSGLSPIAANLASKGRNGDTLLAHISPEEARLLHSLGGAGTINPSTGLPEYFDLSGLIDDIIDPVTNAVGSAADWVGNTVGSAFGGGSDPFGSGMADTGPQDFSGSTPVSMVDAPLPVDPSDPYGNGAGLTGAQLFGLDGSGGAAAAGSTEALWPGEVAPGAAGTGATSQAPQAAPAAAKAGSTNSGGGGSNNTKTDPWSLSGLVSSPKNLLSTAAAGLAVLGAINQMAGGKASTPASTPATDGTQAATDQAKAGILYNQLMNQQPYRQDVATSPYQRAPIDASSIPMSQWLTYGSRPAMSFYGNQNPTPYAYGQQNPANHAEGGDISRLDDQGYYDAQHAAAIRAHAQQVMDGGPVPHWMASAMQGPDTIANAAMQQYDDRFRPGTHAQGGDISGLGVLRHPAGPPQHVSGRSAPHVAGPGGGREDLIPAMLSDGEHVIDAETNALAGDGDPHEGSKFWEAAKQIVREQKGKSLAKGKISPDAASPQSVVRQAQARVKGGRNVAD